MTAPELMPCPWCGSAMRTAIFSVVCSNVECTYRYRTALVGTCEVELAASVEFHNDTARRAEIGKLVEEIIASQYDIDARLFIEASGHCAGLEDQFSRITTHAGLSLLEVLRSLAAEVTK